MAVKFGLKFSQANLITAKPLEVRMGSGKGAPEGWVAVVKPGKVMFEIAGVSEEVATRSITSCNAQTSN